MAAREAGDLPLAIAQLRAHLGSVAEHLGRQADASDPLAPLRAALSPRRRKLFSRLDLSPAHPEKET